MTVLSVSVSEILKFAFIGVYFNKSGLSVFALLISKDRILVSASKLSFGLDRKAPVASIGFNVFNIFQLADEYINEP